MAEYKNEVNAQSKNAKLEITKSQDMEAYFLELAAPNPARVNRNYLAGATFNKFDNGTIIAWYNGQPFHTAPLTLNLVHNAIVKTMIGPDHNIQLHNYPMENTTKKSQENDSEPKAINGSGLFEGLGVLLCFVTANYIMGYIKVNLRMTSSHCSYFNFNFQFGRNGNASQSCCSY